MFCPKCGKELSNSAVFCTGCGSRMGEAPATATVAPELDFSAKIKEVLSSGLFLAIAILSTLNVLYYAGTNIIAILTAIAMWVIYGAAKSENNTCKTGLKFSSGIIRAKYIINWVAISVLAVILVILLIFVPMVKDVIEEAEEDFTEAMGEILDEIPDDFDIEEELDGLLDEIYSDKDMKKQINEEEKLTLLDENGEPELDEDGQIQRVDYHYEIHNLNQSQYGYLAHYKGENGVFDEQKQLYVILDTVERIDEKTDTPRYDVFIRFGKEKDLENSERVYKYYKDFEANYLEKLETLSDGTEVFQTKTTTLLDYHISVAENNTTFTTIYSEEGIVEQIKEIVKEVGIDFDRESVEEFLEKFGYESIENILDWMSDNRDGMLTKVLDMVTTTLIVVYAVMIVALILINILVIGRLKKFARSAWQAVEANDKTVINLKLLRSALVAAGIFSLTAPFAAAACFVGVALVARLRRELA